MKQPEALRLADLVSMSVSDRVRGKAAAELRRLHEVNTKLQKQAHDLWMLLDDIDTADDIAKADDKLYRGLCQQHQQARWSVMSEHEFDAARAALGETK